MNVLIACEESQIVCTALRELGHESYSCDIQECSGGHPEWHILGDVLPLINGNCEFVTMDGMAHKIDGKWDLLIAHPPCTYLSFAGNRHYSSGEGFKLRLAAVEFFMKFINSSCDHICVENPLGYINSCYRKPDQIIHPYMFGDPYMKRTCLWLKNLPLLEPDYLLKKPEPVYIQKNGKRRYWTDTVSSSDRRKSRSKTFPGIAAAMAYQFTNNFFF